MPFNSNQIKDYLETEFGLTDEAMSEKIFGVNSDLTLLEYIANEYMFDLIAIERLMHDVGIDIVSHRKYHGKQQKVAAVDAVKLSAAVFAKKQFIYQTIGAMCVDSCTFEKLAEFVKLKGADAFNEYEFEEQFGPINDPKTIGYRLLQSNYMYYQIQDGLLSFHHPIVRNAITDWKKLH